MNEIEPGSIVCGVDGSEGAARALRWAAEQASLERRPLVVVTAAGVDQVGTLGWAGVAGTLAISSQELLERVGAVADTAAATVRDTRSELDVVPRGALGDPRELLTRLSADAHLVVMGSRGRGVLRSMLLGSVSATVSRHAECPVVICRPESPGKVRKGVLVGVDGTPESEPMLDFAFRTASARHLPLTVLHSFHDVLVAVQGPHVVRGIGDDLEQERRVVAEALAGFSEKYPDVPVRTTFARGFPAECLAAGSERWHLIVVGRHPTDSLSRMLSPTVASAVVERARTTVAVVPVPAPAL